MAKHIKKIAKFIVVMSVIVIFVAPRFVFLDGLIDGGDYYSYPDAPGYDEIIS